MKLLRSLKIHSTHVVDDGEILCTQVSEMSHIDRLRGNPLVNKSFSFYVLGDLALKLKRQRSSCSIQTSGCFLIFNGVVRKKADSK